MPFIVCLPWELRPAAPNLRGVKKLCSDCARELVLQAENEGAALSMRILCPGCAAKRFPNLRAREMGGLVNGQKLDLPTALAAVDALRRSN